MNLKENEMQRGNVPRGTMRRTTFKAMTILLAAALSLPGSAAIYKCPDADGKITFGDKPCADAGGEEMQLFHDAPGDAEVARLQDQVSQGKVAAGMTASQVLQAWGDPQETHASKKSGKAQETWTYQRDGRMQRVTIVDGKVAGVSQKASPAKDGKSVPSGSANSRKSSAVTGNAAKADERRFIREGMASTEVRSRIGAPDSQGTGACRERTSVNSKKQLKTTRSDCENCWVYEPAENDPQTRTRVCFRNGKVSSLERSVVR